MGESSSSSRDLFPGALEMMVLRTLQQQPLHGYALVQHIKRSSRDLLQVEEGSLYPALQRMLRAGWVKARWGVSPTGRRDEMSRFERMLEGIQLVLAAEKA